jgi:hypothetical protein
MGRNLERETFSSLIASGLLPNGWTSISTANQPPKSRTFLTRGFPVFIPATSMTIRAKDHSILLGPNLITSHLHPPSFCKLAFLKLKGVLILVLLTAFNAYTSIFPDACDEMMKTKLIFCVEHLGFRQRKRERKAGRRSGCVRCSQQSGRLTDGVHLSDQPGKRLSLRDCRASRDDSAQSAASLPEVEEFRPKIVRSAVRSEHIPARILRSVSNPPTSRATPEGVECVVAMRDRVAKAEEYLIEIQRRGVLKRPVASYLTIITCLLDR